jgi:hypothetical protein
MMGARPLLWGAPEVNVTTEPDPPVPLLLMISVEPVPCVDAPPGVPAVPPDGDAGATVLEPAVVETGVVVVVAAPAGAAVTGATVTGAATTEGTEIVEMGGELGATGATAGVEMAGDAGGGAAGGAWATRPGGAGGTIIKRGTGITGVADTGLPVCGAEASPPVARYPV